MKDWTGNKKSVFTTLGASNHSDKERETHDYYATDPLAIDKLKSKFEIPHFVLEPSCGEGHLSRRLIELGHEVWSYDIVDRGYGEIQNFFEMLTLPISLWKSGVCNHYKPTIQVCLRGDTTLA